MESEFILLFGILLLIITAISFFVKMFKQPIIIGYVLAGLAFSMFFIKEGVSEQITVFSEIGITFLLFLMGLEFDLKSLKYLGKDMFIATFIQSIVFFGAAFGAAFALGFSQVQSMYMGILFMFSSTLLVAKWLDDKRESQVLHGKIILGVLIIQDIFAILIMTLMSVLKESSLIKIVTIPLQGILLVIIAIVFSKYLLNFPLKLSSKYPELLFLMGLSVCYIFVELASLFQISTSIGAFIGGIVLANTLYKTEVISRLKPLVTFFNMLFFVGLGFQIGFSFNVQMLIFIGVLMILSFTLKPFVIYLTLRARGYDLRTSALSGIYLSQLSEFGIIIMAGGVASGQVNLSASSIAIIAVILSMIISSYLIKYDKKLYKKLEAVIINIDKKFVTKEIKEEKKDVGCHILFFGYYDVNQDLIIKFRKAGKKIAAVENDPENIALMKKQGIELIYGSVGNPDFFEHHNFDNLEIAISSIVDVEQQKVILMELKERNPKALVIVTAKSLKDSLDLYRHNADYVIYSSLLNEQRVSVILDEYTSDVSKVIEKKMMELSRLKEKDRKITESRDKEFSDIDNFIGRAIGRVQMHKKGQSLSKHKKKSAEEESEDDDAREPNEFRTLGDRYL